MSRLGSELVGPNLIQFLGYNPIPRPDNLLERLSWFKLINGLTLEELGFKMDRDPEQLSDWLAGRHKPCQKNRKKIEEFLSDSLMEHQCEQRS